MMRHCYNSRKSSARASSSVRAIFSVGAIALALYGVYQSIQWFRASNEEVVLRVTEERAESVSTGATAPSVIDASTSLLLPTGDSTGVVYRRGTSEFADFNIIVDLPAVSAGFGYEVWMLKDGIADVRSVGMLEPRADGSFVKAFSSVDPLLFRTIVIMLEEDDGMTTPSGNRVAEAIFAL